MGAAGPAARREEGEYSPYLTDEQRSRRAGSARFGDGRLLPRAARVTGPIHETTANRPRYGVSLWRGGDAAAPPASASTARESQPPHRGLEAGDFARLRD